MVSNSVKVSSDPPWDAFVKQLWLILVFIQSRDKWLKIFGQPEFNLVHHISFFSNVLVLVAYLNIFIGFK